MSLGNADTLLAGGRTAHSASKLPLNPASSDLPICTISKNSGQGPVLKTCKVIIWDECTMAYKKASEVLDRTLKDIRGMMELMGGALLHWLEISAGPFAETLLQIGEERFPLKPPTNEITFAPNFCNAIPAVVLPNIIIN